MHVKIIIVNGDTDAIKDQNRKALTKLTASEVLDIIDLCNQRLRNIAKFAEPLASAEGTRRVGKRWHPDTSTDPDNLADLDKRQGL